MNEANATITLPVSAHLVKLPGGEWHISSADYVTVSADSFARWLMEKFHVTAPELHSAEGVVLSDD